MKIRNGFVSNSSSSSFVVLLPENFIKTIDFDKITDGEEDFPLHEFKILLNDCIRSGGMYKEKIYDYDSDDRDFYNILNNLFEPYIIASIDSSSDDGQIIIVDREKIKKILQ